LKNEKFNIRKTSRFELAIRKQRLSIFCILQFPFFINHFLSDCRLATRMSHAQASVALQLLICDTWDDPAVRKDVLSFKLPTLPTEN
jgi:hypothetical protein